MQRNLETIIDTTCAISLADIHFARMVDFDEEGEALFFVNDLWYEIFNRVSSQVPRKKLCDLYARELSVIRFRKKVRNIMEYICTYAESKRFPGLKLIHYLSSVLIFLTEGIGFNEEDLYHKFPWIVRKTVLTIAPVLGSRFCYDQFERKILISPSRKGYQQLIMREYLRFGFLFSWHNNAPLYESAEEYKRLRKALVLRSIADGIDSMLNNPLLKKFSFRFAQRVIYEGIGVLKNIYEILREGLHVIDAYKQEIPGLDPIFLSVMQGKPFVLTEEND